MSGRARDALARTIELIANDIFGRGPGEDQTLEEAILDGLMSTTIRLSADSGNLSSYAGQTALVTLFGLVAMMGIGIELDIPETRLLGPQPPLHGDELRSALVSYGNDVIPDARIGTDVGRIDGAFVLGNSRSATADALVRVSGDAWRCIVSGTESVRAWEDDWPVGALAAAAAAAPEAFRFALHRILERVDPSQPLTPGFARDVSRTVRLDLSIGDLSHLELGDIDVVSGGAITTSLLYCLTRLPGLSGRFRIMESDIFDWPNLNRYPLARRADIGRPKVDVLQIASSEQIAIEGIRRRFDSESKSILGQMRQRVLAGVDDIPSRWEVQRATGGWLSIGATSHFYALVTTHQPQQPCAGCAHPRDEEFPGNIPTISFVSFWAGLMQARSLLMAAIGRDNDRAVNIWPMGLDGRHGIHVTETAPRRDCPVACSMSQHSTQSEPLPDKGLGNGVTAS